MSTPDSPVAFLCDLDGTGSLHPCAEGDEGAFPVYADPVPRTVPQHQCPEDGKCAVCNTPSWQVRCASEIELLLGQAPRLTVVLLGNDPAEIAEAYASVLEMNGWPD